MITLPLPPLCLTLTPPWPQAIAYAGKRLENRFSGVAKGIGAYRGLVGLSQSKNWDRDEEDEASLGILMNQSLDVEMRMRFSDAMGYDGKGHQDRTGLLASAGKLWLVADLVDVLPPDRCEGANWHVSGQWGLILGQVYEAEPVACMGGQGAWRPQWCAACAKVIADSHGKVCKACKSTLLPTLSAPALRVVREL
jgi:hypothetical protein